MNVLRRSLLVATIATCAVACTNGGVIDVTPAPDAATLPPTFVGAIDGTDARFGLVVENGKAFLFFCGGDQTYATHTKWFRGDVSLAAPFTLTQTGWTATGTLDANGSAIHGTLDRGDGNLLTWSGSTIAPNTDAGLYEATNGDGTGALIVLQPTPADTPVLQGAFKTIANRIFQVVPVARRVGSFQVSVMLDTNVLESLVMVRAVPQ